MTTPTEKPKTIRTVNASQLEDQWDEDCEANILDPGGLFTKTIQYCRELERKIYDIEHPLEPEPTKTEKEMIELEICNHVIDATGMSGNCIKCGKNVCVVINNNLHEKGKS